MSEDELQSADANARREVEQGFMMAKRVGLTQKMLKWDRLKIVKFSGYPSFLVSYVRQMNDQSPVRVLQYRIGDDDRMHYISFSYRLSESDMWLPVWKELEQTFRFLR